MRILTALLAVLLAFPGLRAQETRPAAQDAVSLNAEALKAVEAKKLDEALALIEKARKLAPSDEVISKNEARILTRRAQQKFEAGDLDATETELMRALELAPK